MKTPPASGMQQGGSFEGFGKNPAAVAPHFAKALKRPTIEGERHRKHLPSVNLVRQAER
jgi:hypothetical protein